MQQNTEQNFGITLDDLVCFKAVIPSVPLNNKEALNFIRDGIELFEIPGERLGMPLEMLEQQISVDILAGALGLGHLLVRGDIPAKKEGNVAYDRLLSREPHEIIKAFIEYGFNYNGIRRFKKRGFTDLKGRYSDRIKSLPSSVKDEFMHSLRQAKETCYARPPLDATVNRVYNLIAETYANKHGKQFWAQTRDYKMRRAKIRSQSKGREGVLYIAREKLYDNGNKRYSCTCPARVECWHIKDMKAGKL